MTLNNSELIHPDWVSYKAPQCLDLNQEFEKLAFLTAQAWKDDHLEEDSDPQRSCDACILYVITEMIIAARAVGGPAGLAIMAGGGSRAARIACRRVLAAVQEHA